jgi:hypothetical protein
MKIKKISALVSGDRILLDDERVAEILSVSRNRIIEAEGGAFTVKWLVGKHRGEAIHGGAETVALATLDGGK